MLRPAKTAKTKLVNFIRSSLAENMHDHNRESSDDMTYVSSASALFRLSFVSVIQKIRMDSTTYRCFICPPGGFVWLTNGITGARAERGL